RRRVRAGTWPRRSALHDPAHRAGRGVGMTSLDRTLSDPVDLNRLGLGGRSFTKETDVTVAEWHGLLDLARDLKVERAAGMEYERLEDLNLALIFEKSSTRTRCAFEVAAH